ncbi:MAG: hypothetical protein ACRCUY_10870 [Thermoguttaceae bacterium]
MTKSTQPGQQNMRDILPTTKYTATMDFAILDKHPMDRWGEEFLDIDVNSQHAIFRQKR